MSLEIDMLSLGNADAIILQAHDSYNHRTILIDGGNAGGGEKVVAHIRKWARGKVDLLINTHPDADHVDGLHTVVNELSVGLALIHDPSAHHPPIKALLKELSSSLYTVSQEVYKSLSSAAGLIDLLDNKGIRRLEPFTGVSCSLPDDISLTIVGPTEEYYNQLLAGMKDYINQAQKREFQKQLEKALREMGMITSSRTKQQTPEEVIDEKDEDSPSNNSGALVLITYQGNQYLFTADAGPVALDAARQSYLLNNLHWMQVPHHGSRRNLRSDLVAYFCPTWAFVSAVGGKDQKHPNPNVIKALKNVGTKVYGTNNNRSLWFHKGTVPDRDGYSAATPL